jgi:hypothetical protein
VVVFRCVLCGRSHLPSERCGSDTEAGLVGARVALARVEAPVVEEGSNAKGRGRPRIVGARPWEVAGISRSLWYRRRKAEQ